jgi:hypothetical protein
MVLQRYQTAHLRVMRASQHPLHLPPLHAVPAAAAAVGAADVAPTVWRGRAANQAVCHGSGGSQPQCRWPPTPELCEGEHWRLTAQAHTTDVRRWLLLLLVVFTYGCGYAGQAEAGVRVCLIVSGMWCWKRARGHTLPKPNRLARSLYTAPKARSHLPSVAVEQDGERLRGCPAASYPHAAHCHSPLSRQGHLHTPVTVCPASQQATHWQTARRVSTSARAASATPHCHRAPRCKPGGGRVRPTTLASVSGPPAAPPLACEVAWRVTRVHTKPRPPPQGCSCCHGATPTWTQPRQL